MKKNILWLLLVFLFYGCGGGVTLKKNERAVVNKPPSPQPSRPTKPSPESKETLTSSGSKILLDGKPFYLRGLNIADPWHIVKRDYRNDPKKNDFLLDFTYSAMELGGNVVRIPLLQRDKYKEGFLDDPNFHLKMLIPLVDFITKAGQYVIIDCHYVSNWDKVERLDLYLFWDLMVQHFGNNPKVIFEVFNEPIKPVNWQGWVNCIQPVVNQIRKSANNLIIVGGPYWSSRMKGADDFPVQGENLVYTAHTYSNQGDDPSYNYPSKKPVFVTEWGYEKGGTEGGTRKWATNLVVNFLEDKSWTMWCYDWEWGPRMIDKNRNLTDSGRFYQDIIL